MKAGVFNATAFLLPPKIPPILSIFTGTIFFKMKSLTFVVWIRLSLPKEEDDLFVFNETIEGPRAPNPLYALRNQSFYSRTFFVVFVKFANVPKLLNSSHSKLAYTLGLTGRVFKILFR